MVEGWPKIKARNTKRVSPWMAIIEREVQFAPGAEREIYHAVSQQDYVTIVAALPDSRLPIVRQYRPALESFTWEFPAGSSIRTRMRPRAAAESSWRRLALPPVPCMH
jgi:ADP-ribose pyrophosphatase